MHFFVVFNHSWFCKTRCSSTYHDDLHQRKYNYKITKIIQPAQKPQGGGGGTNCPHYFWKNLAALVIYCWHSKCSLKGLQITSDPTKIKELTTISCCKYKLTRACIGIINLANLKVMFIWRNQIYQNAKNSMQRIFTTFNYSYTCNSVWKITPCGCLVQISYIYC